MSSLACLLFKNKKKRRNPTPLLQLPWLGQKPPLTMGICEHSVLFCHHLSSGGLGLPTFDRIEKLLENDTIYEAAKISISLYIYIPCIIALRSILLFLVPHHPNESKPELILGQYTPKRQLIMQSYFWTATQKNQLKLFKSCFSVCLPSSFRLSR